MTTAQLQITIDPHLKNEATRVAAEMGVSLSALITTLLRQVVQDRPATVTARVGSDDASTD